MKKTILALALTAVTFSCKKDNSASLTTYNYADKPETLACTNIDTKLFSEAYYAFENAMLIQTANTSRRPGQTITNDLAYRNFTARSQNAIHIEDYITEEAATIYQVLKTKDIWDGDHLNYNSEVIKCIAGSIKNAEIKQTFKALQEINSLDPRLMAATIYGNTDRYKFKDNALMTYVALDMFYAKMSKVDFSTLKYSVKIDKPATTPPTLKRPTKKTPTIGEPIKLNTKQAQKHSPHDGHNH